jgi:glycosyltransferase involved in cell wall biosynthesis
VTTVCFPFVGDLIGGSHVSAAGLIRRLDRARYTPLVLLQHPDGAMARFFAEAGIATEPAPLSPEMVHGRAVSPAGAARLVATSLRLRDYLRARGIGIVHSNDGRSHATWGLAAKLARARLLWHHRGAPDAMGLRVVAPLLADRVVSVSSFSAPKAGRYSAAARTRVIRSPFDHDMHHDRAEARVALAALIPRGGGTRYVAYAGVMIERKRPLLFVDAIAALHARRPELDIAGVMFGEALDGMDEQVRARAAAAGVADRIHLLGHRTPGGYWLAASDVLMVPAVDEPFGRTLVEAMLVGTPVVATRSGGNVEAIAHERTGLLVAAEDADALADGCARVLGDPALAARIARDAAADARARFGEQAHADAIMAVYDEMLADGAR